MVSKAESEANLKLCLQHDFVSRVNQRLLIIICRYAEVNAFVGGH